MASGPDKLAPLSVTLCFPLSPTIGALQPNQSERLQLRQPVTEQELEGQWPWTQVGTANPLPDPAWLPPWLEQTLGPTRPLDAHPAFDQSPEVRVLPLICWLQAFSCHGDIWPPGPRAQDIFPALLQGKPT